MMGTLYVGRTKYSQDNEVASTAGRKQKRLHSTPMSIQITRPRIKIPHVSDHKPRDAELQIGVPNALPYATRKLQPSGSNNRAAQKKTLESAAISRDARLALILASPFRL